MCIRKPEALQSAFQARKCYGTYHASWTSNKPAEAKIVVYIVQLQH